MAKTTQLAGRAAGSQPGKRSLRAALFERIMCRIQRYFHKLVWDADAVDDCVQNTFLRLERSLTEGGYDPRRSFNSWMWLKAHAVFVDYCRAGHHRLGPLLEHESTSPSAVPAVDARIDARALLAHLGEHLSAESFEAFVLHYDQHQGITAIASLQGRARKTVRKELRAARERALRFLSGRRSEEKT